MASVSAAGNVHLVGTVPLRDPETVFRTACDLFGDRIRRLPDGETGERTDWVWVQVPVLRNHPDLLDTSSTGSGRPQFAVRDGVPAAELDLGDIGYARYAVDSYAVFRTLKAEGIIADHVRFQVNLPTPTAIVFAMGALETAATLEEAYERALVRELAHLADHVPAGELAVQWDVSAELRLLAAHGRVETWFDDEVWAALRARLARLGALIPHGAELGFHLCYGDYQHRRHSDLDDGELFVSVAHLLRDSVARPIDFLHLPVRGDVDPDAYLAPLSALRLDDGTELYLGVITDHGGLAGTMRRIEAARRYINGFGIGAECGLGRRQPDAVMPLLELHVSAIGRYNAQ